MYSGYSRGAGIERLRTLPGRGRTEAAVLEVLLNHREDEPDVQVPVAADVRPAARPASPSLPPARLPRPVRKPAAEPVGE